VRRQQLDAAVEQEGEFVASQSYHGAKHDR
jgi:hypothetical protein